MQRAAVLLFFFDSIVPMPTFFRTSLYALAILLFFAPPAKGQDAGRLFFFAIADLRDTVIGSDKDFLHLQALGQEVADATGLELVPYYYPQETLAAYVLIEAIRNLECGPDDVIWFYYSGHGVAADRKAGDAATFRLGSYNFAIDRVHHELLSRQPGLLLTFYDCCAYSTQRPFAMRMAPMRGRAENYRRLFLETRGDLMVQSSSDQYAYGDPRIGGLFTYALRRSMNYHLSGPESACSWPRILGMASRETAQMAHENDARQVPFYVDNLRDRVLRLSPRGTFDTRP
ncbi:MAG: hypothetical protein D6722_18695 [Bacteroidetes bacterium]|nr:MAG: hypothetical protein D6722_18695 [Bacteroidota bacterium]